MQQTKILPQQLGGNEVINKNGAKNGEVYILGSTKKAPILSRNGAFRYKYEMNYFTSL